jgi:hypothetical protein
VALWCIFIAAQEIKQIILNLGAKPRNRGALDGFSSLSIVNYQLSI